MALARALVGTMFGAACATHPISMKVQVGSTTMIPLPDYDFALSPGFGSEVTQSHQDFDDQRGEFVFYLRGPLDLPEPNQVNYRLKTRYVTRIYPDPAANSVFNSQLLALVDIPLTTDPTYPGPSVTSDKQFKVLVYRTQRNLSTLQYEPETPYFADFGLGTPDLRVTVTPGVGEPNPYEGWQGALSGSTLYTMDGMYSHVPAPQLIIRVGSPGAPGPGKPGAASLELSYPQTKVLVVGVSEWQKPGRYSVLRWRDIGGGKIRIWLVDPDESVEEIAVAFRLQDPVTLGRVTVGEFSISQSKFYHKSGLSYTLTGYPTLLGIR
ncbi:MAG: hypothetical protein WEF50_10180 [Myxococcota bacterium]